jgi:hypothetical protein
MRENAVASDGTDGVGLGFTRLWDCLTIIEFDITRSESAAGSIGPINLINRHGGTGHIQTISDCGPAGAFEQKLTVSPARNHSKP